MQAKRVAASVEWEKNDFPAVCEKCLGPNVYTRMTRESHGRECKICSRPFNVFRWLPTPGSKWKRTDICMTCARSKNCCQSCLLDLQYGLPIQVRDAALKLIAQAPTTDINREYHARKMEGTLTNGEVPKEFEKTDERARELLAKLAKSKAYQQQSAWDEQGKNSTSSYVGAVNYAQGNSAPPADKKITSLFLTGVDEDLPEHAIRSFFSKFGPIRSLVCVHRARSAFVNFGTRVAAEKAASTLQGQAVINDCSLQVQWGRPRPLGNETEESQSKKRASDASQPWKPKPHGAGDYMPKAAPGKGSVQYASTNPNYMA